METENYSKQIELENLLSQPNYHRKYPPSKQSRHYRMSKFVGNNRQDEKDINQEERGPKRRAQLCQSATACLPASPALCKGGRQVR